MDCIQNVAFITFIFIIIIVYDVVSQLWMLFFAFELCLCNQLAVFHEEKEDFFCLNNKAIPLNAMSKIVNCIEWNLQSSIGFFLPKTLESFYISRQWCLVFREILKSNDVDNFYFAWFLILFNKKETEKTWHFLMLL